MATTMTRDPSPQVQAAIESQQGKTLAQLIEDRQKQFESDQERTNWLNRVREIIRYARSDLIEWLDEDTPVRGGSNTRNMYTSKPTMLLERAADAFIGNVFTPQGWFGLEMADTRLGAIDAVQNWLQDCQEHLYGVYANSNFFSTMPPIAMDTLSIGDGVMYVGNDQDEGMPYFEYREPMAMCWRRDHFGRLITVHEKWTMSAHEAYDRWGDALGEDIRAKAHTDATKQYTFLHVVYKRNDPLLRDFKFPKDRPYIELWIQRGAKENDGHSNPAYEGATDRMGGVIAQEGYFSMPFMDWPYWLRCGEMYGRGAMGSDIFTIKRLHAEYKQMMLAGQRSAAPSLQATKTLQDKIDLSPDGVTWLENASDKVEELHRNIRYPFGMDQLDHTITDISQALHLDFFMMFSNITKEMRVDEIVERVGEKAAALSSRIGLMNRLLLNQTHIRVWQIEQLNGRLPQPPDILLAMAAEGGIDTGISVRYQGPLTSAHEQVFLHRRMASAFQMVSPFAQIDPEVVAAKVDSARGVEDVFDNAGLSKLMRPDEEFEAIMQSNNQARAQQMESEMAVSQAQAMRHTAKAAKDMPKSTTAH